MKHEYSEEDRPLACGKQKIIHDRIVMYFKHGVQGVWNDGYIASLSAALWAVTTTDGVNHTGCKHFDLHNPGQKEMDLEHRDRIVRLDLWQHPLCRHEAHYPD